MIYTADVTGGKPIAVWSHSISGVNAINSLVTIYEIHGRKREVLFCFCPSHQTRHTEIGTYVCTKNSVSYFYRQDKKKINNTSLTRYTFLNFTTLAFFLFAKFSCAELEATLLLQTFVRAPRIEIKNLGIQLRYKICNYFVVIMQLNVNLVLATQRHYRY
jgi:hypothetical protein